MFKRSIIVTSALIFVIVAALPFLYQYRMNGRFLGEWKGIIRDDRGQNIGFVSMSLVAKEWKTTFQRKWPIIQFYPILNDEAGHAFLFDDGIVIFKKEWRNITYSQVRIFDPWVNSDGGVTFDLVRRVYDNQLAFNGRLSSVKGTGQFHIDGESRKILQLYCDFTR